MPTVQDHFVAEKLNSSVFRTSKCLNSIFVLALSFFLIKISQDTNTIIIYNVQNQYCHVDRILVLYNSTLYYCVGFLEDKLPSLLSMIVGCSELACPPYECSR